MAQSNANRKKADGFDQRRDSRKFFVKNKRLKAKCETINGMFSVSVKDLSPGGAFIYTSKKLIPGQEIAMTIKLPTAGEVLMVTGEIARISVDGYGVKFNIIFKG